MRLATVLLSFCVLAQFAQAKTLSRIGDDSVEIEEINAAQFACADNMLCYFSQREINAGIGPLAEERYRQAMEDRFAIDAGSRHEYEYAPILGLFLVNFRHCASGCLPFDTSIQRPGGRAIRVGALICGGQKHSAGNGGRFDRFVKCMSKKMRGKYDTPGYTSHAEFSGKPKAKAKRRRVRRR